RGFRESVEGEVDQGTGRSVDEDRIRAVEKVGREDGALSIGGGRGRDWRTTRRDLVGPVLGVHRLSGAVGNVPRRDRTADWEEVRCGCVVRQVLLRAPWAR